MCRKNSQAYTHNLTKIRKKLKKSLKVEPGKTGITYMSYFIKSETDPVSIGFTDAGFGDSFMYAPKYEITNLPYVKL